jgi:hypothetical protein
VLISFTADNNIYVINHIAWNVSFITCGVVPWQGSKHAEQCQSERLQIIPSGTFWCDKPTPKHHHVTQNYYKTTTTARSCNTTIQTTMKLLHYCYHYYYFHTCACKSSHRGKLDRANKTLLLPVFDMAPQASAALATTL